MAISPAQPTQAPDTAPLLGDHLAMDLLNTEARHEGEPVEFWQSDADVLQWLTRFGITAAADGEPLASGVLLEQAKALRSLARALILARKQRDGGEVAEAPNMADAPDIAALNQYLQHFYTVPQLRTDADGKLQLGRSPRLSSLGSLLGPVAEAVAQLLAEGDFSLVRQCEHPDCILWFYDRTKAHKRRWCSMALCGNRHKAAQFRKRNQA